MRKNICCSGYKATATDMCKTACTCTTANISFYSYKTKQLYSTFLTMLSAFVNMQQEILFIHIYAPHERQNARADYQSCHKLN